MKVLIAPWGNPENWKEVEYYYNGEKLNARSTLPLLTKVLEPDVKIIIVLDTLARDNDREDYETIVDSISLRIRKFFNDELNLSPEGIEIIVAPGVGKFTGVSCKGRMKDYYSFVLYKLSELLCNLNKNESIEFHLDLTHGINFMPVMTYMLVNEIAGVFAIRRDVKIKIYNSDPVNVDKELAQSNINIVEDKNIQPMPFRDLLENNFRPLALIDSFSNKQKEDFYRLIKNEYIDKQETIKEINAFIGAVAGGFPLALVTFFPNVGEIKEALQTFLEKYIRSIRLNRIDKKLEIKRDTEFTSDFEVLVKAYLTANVIGLEKKEEVSIDELNEIKEKVFGKFYVLKNNIDKELGEKGIESVEYTKFIKEEWKLYSDIVNESKNTEKKTSQVDLRNFIAHAGLEMNAVELSKKDNTIMLRYVNELLEQIKGYSADAIKIK